MHLRVDDAWQRVQTCRVDDVTSRLRFDGAECNDAAVLHADIGKAFTRMIDKGRAPDE